MLTHVCGEIVNDSFMFYLFFLAFLRYTYISFVVKKQNIFKSLKVTWDLASNYLSLLSQFISFSKNVALGMI